jgi:putative drug exporter of the RND superfamily
VTGTQRAVGGPAGELADFNATQRARIAIVVIAIALAVALLAMLALRAVLLPIVAVALDLLSVAAGFGVLTLLFVGRHPLLGGPGYIDPMSIIGIFAVVFGLTATYEMLLLVRTREQFVAHGHARHSLRDALRATAAASTGAGLVMVAAVIPFATSDLIAVRQFGIGIATVVLIDAFVIRPLLLPAAVAVLGPRCWWPTRGPTAPADDDPRPVAADRVGPQAADRPLVAV